MPKKTLPHVATSEDREMQFHFDAPVPRIGEVLQVGAEFFLVKCVRWQTFDVGEKATPQDQNENRGMTATLTCIRLEGYDFPFETADPDGYLKPGWWKALRKR